MLRKVLKSGECFMVYYFIVIYSKIKTFLSREEKVLRVWQDFGLTVLSLPNTNKMFCLLPCRPNFISMKSIIVFDVFSLYCLF